MAHGRRTARAATSLLAVCLLSSLPPGRAAAQISSAFQELERRVTLTANPEEAFPLAHDLLGMATGSGDEAELLSAYAHLARISFNLGEATEAERYADLGLTLRRAAETSPEGEYSLLHTKALASGRMGHMEEAETFGRAAYESAKELGEAPRLLEATQFMANTHGKLGEHSLALRYHQESLEHFGLEDPLRRLQVLNNVILLLVRMGDLDRALTYSDQAEEVRHALQEITPELLSTSASLLLNRGNILRQRERFQEQLQVLEEADRLLQDSPDIERRNLVIGALADAHLNLADYAKAAEYSRRAMEETDPEETPYPHAIGMANLGLALSGAGNQAEGIEYLAASMTLLERIQARSEALEVQGLLAGAFEANGDYRAAAREYRLFKEATDQFRRDQLRAQLTDAQSEFDITLAQKEVDLLEAEKQVQELVIARQQFSVLAAYMGVLGLCVILGLGWNRYRLKARAFEDLSIAHGKLDKALEEVKTLQDLIPICANCKNIRDDDGLWNRIETYISKNSNTQFSHTFCPECVKELYPEIAEEMGI